MPPLWPYIFLFSVYQEATLLGVMLLQLLRFHVFPSEWKPFSLWPICFLAVSIGKILVVCPDFKGRRRESGSHGTVRLFEWISSDQKLITVPHFKIAGPFRAVQICLHSLRIFSGSENISWDADYVSLFSHGLTPRASIIFLFVVIRHGFPVSILPKVIGDKPAFLASSILLIIIFSLASLIGLSAEILATSYS